MEPITTAALIGGGIAAGQGLISSAFNAHQSKKQMEFQERMSNTAHQREIKDLKAAGLNPILSAKLGGSSTPQGASAQAQAPDIAQASTSRMVAKGQLALQDAQVSDLNSAKALKDAQATDIWYTQEERLRNLQATYQQIMSQSSLTQDQRRKVQSEIAEIGARIDQIRMQTTHSALGLNEAQANSRFFGGKGGDISPWVKHLGPAAQSALHLMRRR